MLSSKSSTVSEPFPVSDSFENRLDLFHTSRNGSGLVSFAVYTQAEKIRNKTSSL